MIIRISSFLSLLLMILLITGCKVKPEPPAFKLYVTPDDYVSRPGGIIEVECEKVFKINHKPENYQFTAKYKSNCKIDVLSNKGHYLKVKVDENCIKGKIDITVTATGKGGSTSHSAEVKIKRRMLIWEVLPERPEKIPASWSMVDDFEKSGKFNLWKGFRGQWTYRNGKCNFKIENGLLNINYVLPYEDLSSCGYFEYFKGDEGKAESFDLSPFRRVTFMIKSNDKKLHRVRFELVEYDKVSQVHQGAVGTTDEVILATNYWRRIEIPFPHFAKGLHLKSMKSLSVKIDSSDRNLKSGSILIDNIAFIK